MIIGIGFFETAPFAHMWGPKAEPGSPVDRVDVGIFAVERNIRTYTSMPYAARSPQIHIQRGGAVSHVSPHDTRLAYIGEVMTTLEEQLVLFEEEYGAPADAYPGNVAIYTGSVSEFGAGRIVEAERPGYCDDTDRVLLIPIGMLCASALGTVCAARRMHDTNGGTVGWHEEAPFAGSGLEVYVGRGALKACGGAPGLAVVARTDMFRVASSQPDRAMGSHVFAPIVAVAPETTVELREGSVCGNTAALVETARRQIAELNDRLYGAHDV